MQAKEFVRQKFIYSNTAVSKHEYDTSINIGYGIDNNFVRPMGISMTSIINNNPHEKITFHVFIDFIDEENKNKLKLFALNNNVPVIIYLIDPAIFEQFSYTQHFAKATYNRLLMPKILDGLVDEIIYIDADIQCFNKLSGLSAVNLSNKIAAVVNDIPIVRQRQSVFLKLKDPSYFNAGFMFINVSNWNKGNISEKTMAVAFKNRDRFNWQDQDALNVVLEGKCIYLDKKYDYLLDLKYKNVSIPDNTIFVHYVGRYKPWDEWCLNPLKEKFFAIEKLSLWRDSPLNKISSYKTMKRMGYSHILYGKYRQGLYWYLKYSYTKIKYKLSLLLHF
ncbi:glycosyltransferase family 8 protein [Pectinatus sottacetonis]|uniref:glycosyltransferase family 8 protein n=1 Tax=Pectinatus sottacetonis TaxID=1002795 RepID=UPI0018C79CF1|nr:glycosyltransferase family 8 protein [Pectinatus sottacetonis]